MDRQIRVAANRRGEVAVVFTSQGVMTFFLRTVNRLLQAAQEGVMNRVDIGLIGGFLEHALQGKSVRVVVDLVTKTAGKVGEGLELRRFGSGMNAPQEGHAQ